MSIFGISQISVSMALMPYSFDLGYIIIISFREKVQRLKLAGYCPPYYISFKRKSLDTFPPTSEAQR